ncbi:MAG: TROVE domain-containing protein [Syntrophobacteraceae bacterium]|nr:TROVE domain-containing protein [Desulfobacteraceae bacterium]
MSFFNFKSSAPKAVNRAGGTAFAESPRLELASILLASFVQDQYYRSADGSMNRLIELIDAIPDRRFAARAAIYARANFGLRSVSHVVAGELLSRVKGEQWMKRFLSKVIQRPDDMTEILACYQAKFGRSPVPNALKKGFAEAFARFDEYQLAKYRKRTGVVSLVDVVNVCHPRPTEGNAKALRLLVADELRSEGTWESALTRAGQAARSDEEKAELKRDAWTRLVRTRKIGYFALLRNLRNILAQAPDLVEDACALLVDERLIRKSGVLPFRFATALGEIEKLNSDGVQQVIAALNRAADLACANVPEFEGRMLVALDCSGSMMGRPSQIASLFAAVLLKANAADLLLFDMDARYRSVNRGDGTLSIAESLRLADGGTNFKAIFERANRAYDRIVILSDMQGWMGGGAPVEAFSAYRRRFRADPKVYSFDLAGYGTLQFPERNVFCLAGFSENVFEIMNRLETDRNALVTAIEEIEL